MRQAEKRELSCSWKRLENPPCSRGSSEPPAWGQGDTSQSAELIPSHPRDKNFIPAAPTNFISLIPEGAERGLLRAGAFSKPEQARSLSASRFGGQRVQIWHLLEFCRSVSYLQLRSHPGSDRGWRGVTQRQLIRANFGSCLLSSVHVPAKGRQSKSRKEIKREEQNVEFF